MSVTAAPGPRAPGAGVAPGDPRRPDGSGGAPPSGHVPTPARDPASPRRLQLAWAALVVLVVAALVVGVGRPPTGNSDARRAAAIDARIRCPSCDGISVADSSAGTAVEIRAVVAREVRAGRSDQQIVAGIVARYGPSIELQPPKQGLVALVWILPLVALGGGLAGLAVVFWRRRYHPEVHVDDADRRLVDDALARRAGGAEEDRAGPA